MEAATITTKSWKITLIINPRGFLARFWCFGFRPVHFFYEIASQFPAELGYLCVEKKNILSVMLSWCWVFFPSFPIYAFVTKPSLYATETIHGKSLPSGPSHQELALITSVPRVDRAVIQKRANVATCAYVSGNAGTRQ